VVPQVEALVRPLAAAAGLESAADVAVAAAHLAKADLATSTVMEMTALAGTMGRHYALKQGLEPQVWARVRGRKRGGRGSLGGPSCAVPEGTGPMWGWHACRRPSV
jgi:hypothetical protein